MKRQTRRQKKDAYISNLAANTNDVYLHNDVASDMGDDTLQNRLYTQVYNFLHAQGFRGSTVLFF